MKNMEELIGIINGINFDNVINEQESQYLQNWINKNRNFITNESQNELINIIDKILEDGIITDDERNLLVSAANQYTMNYADCSNVLNELYGIINGIICDQYINDLEIFHLKNWMDEYQNILKKLEVGHTIYSKLLEILEDGIITKNEQHDLIELLNKIIKDSQLEAKIDHIRYLIRNHKNIGLELIDLLNNQEAIDYIHSKAEKQLLLAMRSYSGCHFSDPQIVIISLVLIAMLNYDGDFYSYVRNTYKHVYAIHYNTQVEGLIRYVLKINQFQSSKNSNRIINFALENALVPRRFLPDFFDFIYDIYKLNFNCELSQDLHSDFQFIYQGLKNMMELEDDTLEIPLTHKNYKLIKTTKNVILDEEQQPSIIELSIIIIKLIDKRIHNKDFKIYNSYLKTGFNIWEKRVEHELNKMNNSLDGKKIYSRWEPIYLLKNNTVHLSTPVHKVSNEYYFQDISIEVYNNDKLIYENHCADIREIIGGYEVCSQEIPLDDPLGKILYKVKVKDKTLYSSQCKLHRDFIVFDLNGFEIKNNTEYKGTVILCTTSEMSDMSCMFKARKYSLYTKNVTYTDSININDHVFNFSALEKPGIYGEKYVNVYIKNNKNEVYDVFKDIKFMVFEDNVKRNNFEIFINGKEYTLNDFHYKVYKKDNLYRYIVDLNISNAGMYEFQLYDVIEQKLRRKMKNLVVCDPGYSFTSHKLTDDTYAVHLLSDLMETNIHKNISISLFDEYTYEFSYKNNLYYYQIPTALDIYRIDGLSWNPITQPLFIDQIKSDTKMDIYNLEIDHVCIYSSKGYLLDDDIKLSSNNTYQTISLGFLQNYKSEHDYVMICLMKEGRIYAPVFCYNKCTLNTKLTEIITYSKEGLLKVTPVYYGSAKVFVEVNDEQNNVVYKSGLIKSGESVFVENLKSFEVYSINIYEKPKGLLKKENRLLKRYTKQMCMRKDFEGHSFKIKHVFYNEFVNDIDIEKSCEFKNIYVCFSKQIDLDHYEGYIWMRTSSRDYVFKRINPVEIEICNDNVFGEMDIYITNDEDGLFLDEKNCRILDSLDSWDSPDICLYTIDVDKEVKHE